jgi:periplasmic divalent cation tolerance protein
MSEQTSSGYMVVLMTSPDREESRRIARTLVEERAAACVSVFPRGESYFRWQGKIEREEEFLLIAKTRASLLPALTAAVKRIHGYEVPEIVALPVTGGSRDYLEWLGREAPGE